MTDKDPLDIKWWESPDGGVDWQLLLFPIALFVAAFIGTVAVLR